MTLEKIKEIAKTLIIVRGLIGNSAEDSKAIQSDLERAFIRVHNEAIEAAANEVNEMRGREEIDLRAVRDSIKQLKLHTPTAEQGEKE